MITAIMKRLIFAFLVFCLLVGSISAQHVNNRQRVESGEIPAKLKPKLDKRLAEFVEVQRQEKWERVFDFLIETQNAVPSEQFDAKQKQCFIEQIKANPMINFKFLDYGFSSRNFSVPLDEQEWRILGNTVFKNNSKIKTALQARYFNQNWFFSVPEYYHQEWRRGIVARSNPSADLSNLLKVVEQTDSPVEIFDISVKADPESYYLRRYSFKGRNKSGKTISFISYHFIEAGLITSGGRDIKPGEADKTAGFYGSNHPFCKEKEPPVRVFISAVYYTDGTEWKSKIKLPSPFD